jgi:hypothetical protein
MPVRCLAVLLAALAPLLAGCGGGKDTEHAAFADSLNAICRAGNARLLRLRQPTTPAEIPGFAHDAVAIIAGESRALRRLRAPADQRANLRAALDVLRRQAAAADELATAGAGGDTTRIEAINKQNAALHRQGQKLARKMGAKDCAR